MGVRVVLYLLPRNSRYGYGCVIVGVLHRLICVSNGYEWLVAAEHGLEIRT